MENKKEPFLAQVALFLTGLSFFWVGLSFYYINKDNRPVLANNAKSGAILGAIVYAIGVVLKVIELTGK